ncbi:hypothetical protein NLJ89_g2520 [Agrocybe chaxingu]|uniref:F-box domain-containing protein n=1 Tax=Agrocybe chaxingu TaxID=84603 RepID=A0A9W8MYU9_9AGAR|nr:hypothetical protein NLJ89_g2520 [Agrocybe chaxingu]
MTIEDGDGLIGRDKGPQEDQSNKAEPVEQNAGMQASSPSSSTAKADSSVSNTKQEEDRQVAHALPPEKRKISSNAGNPRPVKRARGMRGLLQQLPEMPLDMVYEIFSQLNPLDILNLSRTTKELRKMLLNRSSIFIWRRSRENIEGLPECPKDLSEPQYADLVFGRNCNYCLRNLPKLHVVWDARVKCCKPCVLNKFILRANGWTTTQAYPQELAKLLPTVNIVQGRHGREYGLRALHEAWCIKMASLTDEKARQKWVQAEIWKHRKIYLVGAPYKAGQQEEKEDQVKKRKAIVLERLHSSDWGEELALSKDCKPLELPAVIKVCQKELTERILLNLDEHLNEFMKEAQDKRLFQERAKVMKARLPILKQEHTTWTSKFPPNAIYPPLSEVYRFREIQDIFFADLPGNCPENYFSVLNTSSEHFLQLWDKNVRAQLIQLIKEARLVDYDFDPATVLNLATTFFTCGQNNGPLRYPRIAMHDATVSGGYAGLSRSDERVLGETIGQVYWNQFRQISLAKDVFEIVTALIHLSSYDPTVITAQELNEANPVFECTACSNDDGRAAMTWCTVIAHQRLSHSGSRTDTSKLHLLNEEDAIKARQGIAELQERNLWKEEWKENLICIHCKKTGNMKKLMKHVQDAHGRPVLSKEDFVPNFDHDHTPPLYRLWPPRELLCPDTLTRDMREV